MRHTISVTQADLDGNTCRTGDNCPIALAAKREFGERYGWVTMHELHLDLDERHYVQTRVDLPTVARLFLTRWAARFPVAPFSFTLEVPDGR